MTEKLFLEDAELAVTEGEVVGHDDGAVVLDRTIFYATGGGQPGDSGTLEWGEGQTLRIVEARKGASDTIRLLAEDGADLPPVGTLVTQRIDWDRRLDHMKIHTALHLLSVVLPLPVTGGQIGAGKGRLDFDMPEAPDDKEALSAALNALIKRDLPVTQDAITEAELDANPGLVKTMSVQPPRGTGHIRLIRIGAGETQIDLQPCGGTHVRSTGQIGPLRIGKIEKKGAQNRRVYVHLDG